MTVSSLGSLASGLQREVTLRNARVVETINQLVGRSSRRGGVGDVADLTSAISLQNNLGALRNTALNITEAGAMLERADQGAQGVENALAIMADAAERLSASGISTTERSALTAQFNDARASLAESRDGARFRDRPLLTGESLSSNAATGFVSALSAAGLPDVRLPDFTDKALFGNSNLPLSGVQIARTREVIAAAQTSVREARSEIEALRYSFSFAGGAFESALQNQDAARSILLDSEAGLSSSSRVGQDSAASLLAQANRLPAGILQLLSV